MKRLDLADQRFGRLKALKRMPTRYRKNGQAFSAWECICDCGRAVTVTLGDLKSGNTKSCGCLNLELAKQINWKHGHSKNKQSTYAVWLDMKKRCYNRNHSGWARYGGRGIKVCDRWQSSFENFLCDMGLPPSPAYSIERIDNDSDYEPDNCRWATRHEQARNRRSNIIVTLNGRTQCLLDWCNELNLPYHTIRARIRKLKWSPKLALDIPIKFQKRSSGIIRGNTRRPSQQTSETR